MIRTALLTAAALSLATPGLAQTPPSGGPQASPPPPAAAQPAPVAMPRPPGPPPGPPAASISLRGPHGLIHVRCAPGESTKACADVVGELLGRVAGMASASRDYDRNQRDARPDRDARLDRDDRSRDDRGYGTREDRYRE